MELSGAFTVAIAVLSTCNIFSTVYRRQLVAVFKVSCFLFLTCFASFLSDIIFLPALPLRPVYSLLLHLDPREKVSLPIQDLFCTGKPLTYPGSASVSVDCTEELSIAFASTHLLYPDECKFSNVWTFLKRAITPFQF